MTKKQRKELRAEGDRGNAALDWSRGPKDSRKWPMKGYLEGYGPKKRPKKRGM